MALIIPCGWLAAPPSVDAHLTAVGFDKGLLHAAWRCGGDKLQISDRNLAILPTIDEKHRRQRLVEEALRLLRHFRTLVEKRAQIVLLRPWSVVRRFCRTASSEIGFSHLHEPLRRHISIKRLDVGDGRTALRLWPGTIDNVLLELIDCA